jgi:uncharacterized membrane protein YhhN
VFITNIRLIDGAGAWGPLSLPDIAAVLSPIPTEAVPQLPISLIYCITAGSPIGVHRTSARRRGLAPQTLAYSSPVLAFIGTCKEKAEPVLEEVLRTLANAQTKEYEAKEEGKSSEGEAAVGKLDPMRVYLEYEVADRWNIATSTPAEAYARGRSLLQDYQAERPAFAWFTRGAFELCEVARDDTSPDDLEEIRGKCLLNTAMLALRVEQWELAEQAARRAIAVDVDALDKAHFRLARSLEAQGRRREALDAYRTAARATVHKGTRRQALEAAAAVKESLVAESERERRVYKGVFESVKEEEELANRAGDRRARLGMGLLASLTGNILADAFSFPLGVYICKPVSTLLVIARASVAPRVSGDRRTLLLAALVASLAGDLFLMHPQDMFIQGLVSFLIAHLLFCFLLHRTTTAPTSSTALAAATSFSKKAGGALLLLTALILTLLLPTVPPSLQPPVIVYAVALCAMAFFALRRYAHLRVASAFRGSLGALLFVLSDTALAFDKFRGPFTGRTLLVMTSYNAALWLIAGSFCDDGDSGEGWA